MKWLFLVPSVLIGIGWWRGRRSLDQTVSAQWVKDHARQDLIEQHQWTGIVRWPWDVTSDDQECA